MSKIIYISDSAWNWIMKIAIPLFFTLAASIAIQIKNKTASVQGVLSSIVIALSFTYLTGDYVLKHFSSEVSPVIIGLITISGEKIGYWLIYKFKFDEIGNAIVKSIIKKIK